MYSKPNFFKKNVSSNISKNIIKTNNSTKNSSMFKLPQVSFNNNKYIIIGIICLVALLVFMYIGYLYYTYENTYCFEKKSFYDYIFDFSNTNICIKDKAPSPPKINLDAPLLSIIEDKKEVFHIANQDYTYDQAKCKCEAYGSRLANKNDIIDAYNKGANWCTYGWADKQSAYYPVQKCEWDKIQTENERLPENKKRFCGMPGLNGGYFANPQLKFGATCYGIKPKGTINKMKKPYCPPMNFCKLENNFQSSNKLDTDEIIGFNNEQWNM